jgi:UDP-N-acetylmuramoyl-L-alanyl-D-glutamate--2,6-diaminopimelate ligase
MGTQIKKEEREMKLERLKEKLFTSVEPGPVRMMEKKPMKENIRKNVLMSVNKLQKVDTKQLQIIGITGSKGKSTTAYLVHQYLKSQGYRSILYSSIEIDSPTSYNAKKEAVENPLRDEKMLLNAIIQAEAYEADYLILEVNERSIARGYTKDIPFSIRLITNIIPTHNDDFYPPEQYVAIKKSFFEGIPEEDDCVCIYGIESNNIFNSLGTLNNKPKKVFGSRYVSKVRGVPEEKVDYLLYPSQGYLDTINGLNISFRFGNFHDKIKTNMIMPYNALNILAVIAVLDTLGVYDRDQFQKIISNINIPGRDERTEVNGRIIIVSSHLAPELENFKKYKDRGEIKNIKVVIGTRGDGYKGWVKEFPEAMYTKERERSLRFAYNYLRTYADYVYITTTDTGSSDPSMILSKQVGYMDEDTRYEIEADRKEAIRKAIENSHEGDLIYISGRGNRRVLCNGRDSIKLHLDQEVVEDVLRELKWIE